MAIDDLNFMEWLRQCTQKVIDSDTLIYNGGIYTEPQLFALYKTLKVNEVDVRGYDTNFTMEIRREQFLTLQEVIQHVAKHVTDTAHVICVKHKNYLNGKDIILYNDEARK